MIRRTFYDLTPYTDKCIHMNSFRPLNLVIDIRMGREFQPA